MRSGGRHGARSAGACRLSRWSHDGLTEVERLVQSAQEDELRCAVCKKRGEYVWGRWTCSKGLKWPDMGRCIGFRLEEGAR